MNPLHAFREELPGLKSFLRACVSQEGLVLIFATLIFVTRREVHRAAWWAEFLEGLWPVLADGELRLRVGAVLFWGLIPLALVLLVHRKNPITHFGLRWPHWKWFAFSGLYLLLVHPVNWLYAASPELVARYPLYAPARDGGVDFWAYQALVAVAMLAWEFLLRGYLLFGLKERFGVFAIFVQLLPFVFLHFGYPTSELYFSILDGLFLGAVAWLSRSIWPVVLIHVLQNLLWELEVVYIFRHAA